MLLTYMPIEGSSGITEYSYRISNINVQWRPGNKNITGHMQRISLVHLVNLFHLVSALWNLEFTCIFS